MATLSVATDSSTEEGGLSASVCGLSASLAARAASDAASAVVAVVADAVAMCSAGDAAMQLLRAMGDASIARAITSLPPPAALLYAPAPGAEAEPAPGKRGGRKRSSPSADASVSPAAASASSTHWAASYGASLHGGNALLTHSLRLAGRFVTAAAPGSSSVPAGVPAGMATAQTAAAAALCLLASTAEQRCLAPSAAAADPDAAAALSAACHREAKRARTVWSACVRRLVAAAGGDAAAATAALLSSALPAAVSAMGAGTASVGEAFAAARVSTGQELVDEPTAPLSGIDELGFCLREALKPLATDDAARLRLAQAAAAALKPILESIERTEAEAGTASAAESADSVEAAAKAEIAAARLASKLSLSRSSAGPWLATLSAMTADMSAESKASLMAELHATPPSWGASSSSSAEDADAPRKPLTELLQTASVSMKGPFAAVAGQLGVVADPDDS
jgi:hypothetical protein